MGFLAGSSGSSVTLGKQTGGMNRFAPGLKRKPPVVAKKPAVMMPPSIKAARAMRQRSSY